MGCNEALAATPRHDPKKQTPAPEAANFLADPDAPPPPPRRPAWLTRLMNEPEWIDPNPPEEE